MFMFQKETFLNELKEHNEDIFNSVNKSIPKNLNKTQEIKLIEDEFELCPSVSIDYALLEKTNNAVCFPMEIEWSDLGSWKSIYDVSKDKDKDGNFLKGDTVMINSFNNLVLSDSRIVTGVGISNLKIIETRDAVLVASKDSAKDVKALVNTLKETIEKNMSGIEKFIGHGVNMIL